MERRDLFDFMMQNIKHTGAKLGYKDYQAFPRWFASMYFQGYDNFDLFDGPGDGKVDSLVHCRTGEEIRYHIINAKFTKEYDKASPVKFYDEITRYWQAFANRSNRPKYLEQLVRPELKGQFNKLFKHYDNGKADLFFLTNHQKNERQWETVRDYDVRIIHLDELLQYVAENIEGAMPETEPLLLSGINSVLTPDPHDTEVATSIVFARLVDFIKYMDNDPFELLFARNVRLWLGNTETNKSILKTFKEAPREFAYSNNGITILCRSHVYYSGQKELKLENPRIVNGSQTLHSIRSSESPSESARVMLRIIEVPQDGRDVPGLVAKRKQIIHKISIRSNMQNPIKRWNLVANDDYQMELFRYFWDKGLYYERRQGEWKYKNLELRRVGLSRGPDIRWMTQIIASYYYDKVKLGPAIAMGQLNQLFDEDEYKVIQDTKPGLAYQLYLLCENILGYFDELGKGTKWIDQYRRYADLCLFAILCRFLDKSKKDVFASEKMARYLEGGEEDRRLWLDVCRELVRHVRKQYLIADKKMRREEGKELSLSNFFKNRTLMRVTIESPLPKSARTSLFRLLSKIS